MNISTIEISPSLTYLDHRDDDFNARNEFFELSTIRKFAPMTIHEQKEAGFITLKEASERFGYAPDYIGQLIRKGKIEGKQVYANLAWMTTAEAIEDYIAKDKGVAKAEPVKASQLLRISEYLFAEEASRSLYFFLRGVMVFLVLSILILFYFISIAIDHRLIENAEKGLAARTIVMTTTELAPLAISQDNHGK